MKIKKNLDRFVATPETCKKALLALEAAAFARARVDKCARKKLAERSAAIRHVMATGEAYKELAERHHYQADFD